jgi:hypothetical protein
MIKGINNMKITIRTVKGEYGDELYEVSTPDNSVGLHNLDDCPEDATLDRDLSGIYSLPDMLKEVYEAGTRNEKIEWEEIIDNEF